MNHIPFIHRCLTLATRGYGHVGINPLVGAVLVRDNKIIAEGWHTGFGEDHAERMLIKNLEQTIQQGDALYINLEPCNHHGKTPPCTDLIIESGIKNVVYGMKDPNPEVSGKGIQALQSAGIQVEGPVLEAECRRLNRGFVSFYEQGRPWITLKKAQMKDGSIAHKDGSKISITSEEQNMWSHRNLRARHDAILVGVDTIISDDSQLNTRFIQNKKVVQVIQQPLRIIFDPNMRIMHDARVVNDDLASGTVVITKPDNMQNTTYKILVAKGVTILAVPTINNQFNWKELWKALTTPSGDFHGISSILVEGGPKTWDSFKKTGMIDEEVILVGR